jgi:predicted restriction endonuclease
MSEKIYLLKDTKSILNTIESISPSIFNHINLNPNSEFMLIYKYITHSDLTNSGKRNGPLEDLSKNLLYYLSLDEMLKLEKEQKVNFENAKQSNIFLPSDFFNFFEIPILLRRDGFQEKKHNHIRVNDFANTFLAMDSLKFFDFDYTKRIFEKLEKHNKWITNEVFNNTKYEGLLEVDIHYAIHGIGTKEDEIFHKLRKSIFKNDILCLVLEKNSNFKNLFITLKKNPIFFTILNDYNYKFSDHLVKQLQNDEQKLRTYLESDEQSDTMPQSTWKKALAEEMMNYTSNDNEVFCPLTYISSNFENSSTLYRASHIKPKYLCTFDEMIDVNNGLLLSANADALFDKYFISVDDNCEILYSFLIENDKKLLSSIKLLGNTLFKPLLNDSRKKYLDHHRNTFLIKEEERKLRK